MKGHKKQQKFSTIEYENGNVYEWIKINGKKNKKRIDRKKIKSKQIRMDLLI